MNLRSSGDTTDHTCFSDPVLARCLLEPEPATPIETLASRITLQWSPNEDNTLSRRTSPLAADLPIMRKRGFTTRLHHMMSSAQLSKRRATNLRY
jgi:hypothetical protein